MNELKTIEQLVNYLNKDEKRNDLFQIIEVNKCKRQLIKRGAEYVTFYVNGKWRIERNFPSLPDDKQRTIISFLTDKGIKYDWFKETEYNIIIGHNYALDNCEKAFAVWRKNGNDFIAGWVFEGELNDEPFKFTLGEIEALKETQSENVQKMIDLGKVEVTDK